MTRLTRLRVPAVVAVAAAVSAALFVSASPQPAAPVPVVSAAGPDATATRPDTSTLPVAIRIPRLGVDSPIVPLGVDEAGVLVPPATADVAGWHTGGTVPGEVGPAVVAGHVDSRSGPGVFVDVATLRGGDTIEIEQAGGEILTFTVRSVQTVDKDEFPTAEVYGPTPVPELRLITCGGFFEAADGHYRANVIVDAVRTAPSNWTFRR